MALRFEQEMTMNAPASRIFEYLADLTKHPEWGNQPMSVVKKSDGPVGVGSVFEHTGKQFGNHKDTVTITGFVPGKSLEFESKGDSGLIKHWFRLQEQGSATQVTKGSDFSGGGFSVKMSSPLIKRAAPKDMAGNLAKIKAKVESGA